jgi:very-short-patch-repair endonuclease
MGDIIIIRGGVEMVIRTMLKDDIIIYRVKDICNILQLSNPSQSASNIPLKYKYIVKAITPGGLQKVAYLSSQGMIELLSRTRSIHCIEVAKQLKMNINAYIPACEERVFLSNIAEAFEGEKIKLQFTVLKYRIDLYFLEYKLAIEFDEEYHTQQTDADKIRQTKIEDKLGCTFIRFTKKDSIFKIINKIYQHIKSIPQ